MVFQDFNLDFQHIATLWKLDANHDGVITFEELRQAESEMDPCVFGRNARNATLFD